MANHRNFAQTTLGAAIETTDGTSITVTSETSFPSAPFIISIDTECLLVTNVATTTWTVTRGYEGSTAATHTNGTAVYHDWSAGEADSTVHGPASATTEHLAVFDGATGKIIKDGGAVPAAGLPTTGGTMTGNLVMDNMDIALVKLLTLHGEIDDGNSGAADVINWNAGAAHKSTLTGNVTLAFTGIDEAATTVVPVMTTNTAPSGVASASTDNANAFKAFDENSETNWCCAGNAAGAYIQYQFPTTKRITRYAVHAANYYCYGWTLRGSNNGTDWTTLDTRSGGSELTPYHTTVYFNTAAAGDYLYYRWTIATTEGNYFNLSTLYLIEASAVLNPPAPCFLTLKLVQDATGGRTVTWPATVKGTPLYDLAANAVTNLLFYWDGTYYWVLNNSGWVSTVPASATAKGIAGQYTANGSYFYYCSATDTWVRTALATWT